MKGRFEGQIVIITGGARGIGEGVCEVFCNEGATVALWDVIDGQKAVDRISAKGGHIFYQKVVWLLFSNSFSFSARVAH